MQRLKATVGQDKRATMIRLEVIDLLPEQPRPQIFTHKLDTVKLRRRPWLVSREPGAYQYGLCCCLV